jgi:hypothetical protein
MNGAHAVFYHLAVSLVIIGHLDVIGSVWLSYKTHPPLIIDADAVLPGPVSFEFFQPVGGRGQ